MFPTTHFLLFEPIYSLPSQSLLNQVNVSNRITVDKQWSKPSESQSLLNQVNVSNQLSAQEAMELGIWVAIPS